MVLDDAVRNMVIWVVRACSFVQKELRAYVNYYVNYGKLCESIHDVNASLYYGM